MSSPLPFSIVDDLGYSYIIGKGAARHPVACSHANTALLLSILDIENYRLTAP